MPYHTCCYRPRLLLYVRTVPASRLALARGQQNPLAPSAAWTHRTNPSAARNDSSVCSVKQNGDGTSDPQACRLRRRGALAYVHTRDATTGRGPTWWTGSGRTCETGGYPRYGGARADRSRHGRARARSLARAQPSGRRLLFSHLLHRKVAMLSLLTT